MCVAYGPAGHRDAGIQDVDVATLPFKHENNTRKQRLHNQMDMRSRFFIAVVWYRSRPYFKEFGIGQSITWMLNPNASEILSELQTLHI